MSFQTTSQIKNSTMVIIKLVAAEPISLQTMEDRLNKFDFWNPKTREDYLMRDGAIDFARSILDLEKINCRHD